MRMRAEQLDRGGLSTALGRLADGLARLLSDHVALARVELQEDVRALARDVGLLAAFVPLLVIGYALVCAGTALAIARTVGAFWGFTAVGGINLLLGTAGIAWAARRIRRKRMMGDTRAEVELSATLLAQRARVEESEDRLGA
jgi:uncharacterized membrane protein YqjE